MAKKKNKGKKKAGGGNKPAAATNNIMVKVPEPPVAAAEVAPQPPQTITGTTFPPSLESSMSLFSDQQQQLIKLLCSMGQAHLFEAWNSDNTADADKIALVTQLESLDISYPTGGLTGYIENARELLKKSKAGVNPLEGWSPSVPTGQAFDIGTEEYARIEAIGANELGAVGFVLVAGGLGERLGYGDIKIGLPTELATETCYLQFYIEYILALQSKFAGSRKLPLCIMTSNDTNANTVKLLEENNYFGMSKDQLVIVQQGDGVPALLDNDATISLESNFKVATKPHGHGDIHALIYSKNVAKEWVAQGIKWITFFQDTNGLAFHTLPLTLGVSTKFNLIMNSLTIPRKAKQAVGAITKLTNAATKEERTINVEYNQLDPLLRANGSADGDVNDSSGFSPYPGNINQLLFAAKPYLAALAETKGAMPEFVNPKYSDAEKTTFKKPTRLECMMQDFPTVLKGTASEKVGFTSIAASMCFSPVKNATSDGAELQKQGTHPGVAATGEADQYGAIRLILKSIGVNVEEGDLEIFQGITFVGGPEIVIKPGIVLYPGEYKKLFPSPETISISKRSSLVIKGSGDLVIESLTLDGALIIECEEGSIGCLRDIVVSNAGWRRVAADLSTSEVIAMRGYKMEKQETTTIVVKKDGSIEGYSPPLLEHVVDVTVTTSPASEEKKEDEKIASTPKANLFAVEKVDEFLTPKPMTENSTPSKAVSKDIPVSLTEPSKPMAGNTIPFEGVSNDIPASLTEPSFDELAQSAPPSGCPCAIM